MATETKLMVEPLDVDNYATWSIRMRALLISKGLWTTVLADEPEAGNDLKALAQIILHVKDHHLMTVGACTTAKEAWMKLKTTYACIIIIFSFPVVGNFELSLFRPAVYTPPIYSLLRFF